MRLHRAVHFGFVHGDGSPRHLLNGLVGRQQRQMTEAQATDDLPNGLHQFLFQLASFLLIHRSPPPRRRRAILPEIRSIGRMPGSRRRWSAEMLNLHKIWIEQCEAARGIENEFGTVPAIKYLVGEKFMNYLDAAEKDADFRAELPAFVAEIKNIFEPWQLAEYLEKAGWTEPFDPSLYDEDDEDYDPEEIKMERKDNIRRVAREMLLIERAKEWLLRDDKQ